MEIGERVCQQRSRLGLLGKIWKYEDMKKVCGVNNNMVSDRVGGGEEYSLPTLPVWDGSEDKKEEEEIKDNEKKYAHFGKIVKYSVL